VRVRSETESPARAVLSFLLFPLSETAKTAGAELSPICAIVGGILGQQVIKVISAKGAISLRLFLCA
jgi:hypothetical protein